MIYLHKEKNVESNFGYRPTTLEKAKSSVLSVQVELLSPELNGKQQRERRNMAQHRYHTANCSD